MEQSEYVIVNNGGIFDLQIALGKMPGFIWSKYPGEKHMIYKFPYKSYSYFGPGSRVDIRLDENDQPKIGEEPVSPTDQLALHDDIAYRDAEKLDPAIALQMKHESDKKMIEKLDQVPTIGIIDKFANFTAKKLLQLKLKLGMELNQKIYNKVNELHHRYKEGEIRMVIVLSINHTHSCDIFEYGKVKIFTYIDCVSKKAWVIIVRQKSAENIIKALDYAFTFLGEPKFLWSDNGKEFTNKLVQTFLKEHNVHWHSTYSELKAVIVERFNLTLREWIDKYKTECELKEDQKFNLKEALEKFIEYYNNHEHSTVKMSPNDSHKEENEKDVRHKYIVKYKLKHDYTVKYSVGDLVRIYKRKDTFTKKSGSRFTEEVFKIREIQETKPHIYLLEDLNGDEIKGSFYSFELISVANMN